MNEPILSLKLQPEVQEIGLINSDVSASEIKFLQMRVSLNNQGRTEAVNCKVRVRVSDIDKEGKETNKPVDYALPAFQFFRPEVFTHGGSKLLKTRNVDQISVSVPAKSDEAYGLPYITEGDDGNWRCFLYTRLSEYEYPHELKNSKEVCKLLFIIIFGFMQ